MVRAAVKPLSGLGLFCVNLPEFVTWIPGDPIALVPIVELRTCPVSNIFIAACSMATFEPRRSSLSALLMMGRFPRSSAGTCASSNLACNFCWIKESRRLYISSCFLSLEISPRARSSRTESETSSFMCTDPDTCCARSARKPLAFASIIHYNSVNKYVRAK
jgi:hypothetical protein